MEKIADLLTKFMISESSSENLDYEVCKFGLLMAIEVAINTVIALCISFLLGMFRYGILFLTFFSLLRAFAGGVHLERFWSCTVLSGMVLSMVLLIAKYAVIPSIFSFALCVVMGILIFIVGPIATGRLLQKAITRTESDLRNKIRKPSPLIDESTLSS